MKTAVLEKKDYMGVMVVSHHLNPAPIMFHGQDTASPNVTKVAFYSAARNTETGEVVRQEKVAEVSMSEFQFAQLITSPSSGDGRPVTLTALDGYNVKRYRYKVEESRLNHATLSYLEKGSSKQVLSFIQGLKDMVADSEEKKKISASTQKEIRKTIGMLKTYIPLNEKNGFETFEKESELRAQSILSSIQSTVRDGWRMKESVEPLSVDIAGEDKKEIRAEAFMDINTSNSGGAALFDSGDGGSNTVSIKLTAGENPIKALDNHLAVVNLSLLQFARLVRADSVEVPCTFKTKLGHMSLSAPSADDKSVDYSFIETEAYENYIASLDEMELTLNLGSGVKNIKNLVAAIDKVKNALDFYIESGLDNRAMNVDKVIKMKTLKIQRHFEQELNNIPTEHDKKVKASLHGLFSLYMERLEK
jgi:hypothetical protein